MEVFQHRCWLGHGSYGDVQLCEVSPQTAAILLGVSVEDQEKSAGPTLIALKTWKQAHKDGKVMGIAMRELQILKVVNHPNIIRLQCAFRTPSGRVCMAFEYGGKSAHQLLESRFHCGIPGPLLQRLALQLVHALRYLHSQQIIHRDVKPANVLVDAGGLLRLCDFGFARYTAEVRRGAGSGGGSGDSGGGAAGGGEPLTPYVITRWYRAPEVLLGMPYGTPTDIWSLGCTLAELATGEPILPGESSLDQLGRIVRLLGPMPAHMAARAVHEALRGDASAPPVVERFPGDAVRLQLGRRLDPELLDLVSACLRIDPRDRPTLDELLLMPYCVNATRLFEGTTLGHVYGAGGAAAWAESSTSLSSSPPRPAGASAQPPARVPAPPPSGAGGIPHISCRHHRRLQRPEHNGQGQAYPLHQHQHSCAEPHACDVFRGARGGLPYSCSIASSTDAGTVVSSVLSASASCSFLSASGAVTASTCTLTASRSMTSAVADSLYGSAVALSCSCYCASADCCPVGSGGTRGVVDADGEGCVAAHGLLVSDAVGTVSPAAQAAATAAAASRPARAVGADASVARGYTAPCWHATAGAATSACVSGAAVGGGDFESVGGARLAAAPPLGGGGGDGHTCVSAPRLIGAQPLELSVSTVPTIAAVGVAGYSASWRAPAHPSGFSREAAIRALAAAAAFATGQVTTASAAVAAAAAAVGDARAIATSTAAETARTSVSAQKGADAPPAGAGVASSPPLAQTATAGATGAFDPGASDSGTGRSPPQHRDSCGDVRHAPADTRVVPGAMRPMAVVSVDVVGAGVGAASGDSAASFNGNSGTGPQAAPRQVFCSRKCPTSFVSSDVWPSAAGTAPPGAHPRAAARVAATAAAGPGPGAVQAVVSSTNANGAWVATGPRQPWRATVSGDADNISEDSDGQNSVSSNKDGGAIDAAGPLLERRTAPPPAAEMAALSPSSRWLDAFYHPCSPSVTSAAAAGPLAAARLTTTSATTTMSFNWHNAESPSGDGDSDGGDYSLGGGGSGGDVAAALEEPTLRRPPSVAAIGSPAQPQQPPPHPHHHQPQSHLQEKAEVDTEQERWQHRHHRLLRPGQQPVEQRRQHQAGYVLGRQSWAQGGNGTQLAAGGRGAPAAGSSPRDVARRIRREDQPPSQPQPVSQQMAAPLPEEDATEDEAELALVSCGLWPPGANALFHAVRAAREGSRRRTHAAALPGADAEPDGAGGDRAGAGDNPDGSAGSESECDPEGCRPCDLTGTQSALRKGYASAPGCGGGVRIGSGATGAATAVSSTALRGIALPWPTVPRALPAAAGSRQRLHGALPYNGWGGHSSALAPVPASSRGATETHPASGASSPHRGEAGKPYTGVVGAAPPAAIPTAAAAAAEVARSAIAATNRRCSMNSSQDSASRAMSCRTSFEDRGAGNNGGGGGDDSSGGRRRVKGWLRKSRVWLKQVLEGGGSSSAGSALQRQA